MNKRAKALILGVGLYYLLQRKNTTPVNTTPGVMLTGVKEIDILPVSTTDSGLTAPANLYIGQSGYKYGSDYFALLNELPGESVFWWYGASNGNNYPQSGYGGNGYIECFFPSHSTNWANGNSKLGVIGKIEYKLFAPNGSLIAYVYDTKGGFHPNYGANLRSNNHPDFTNRYLPEGLQVTCQFKNISTDPAATIQLTWQDALKANVPPGGSHSFTFTVTNWNSLGQNPPKLNCNIL